MCSMEVLEDQWPGFVDWHCLELDDCQMCKEQWIGSVYAGQAVIPVLN